MKKVSKSFDGVCYRVDIDGVYIYSTNNPEKAEEVFIKVSNLFSELRRYDPYAVGSVIVEDDSYTPLHIKVLQDKFRVYTTDENSHSITVTGIDRMCNVTMTLAKEILEKDNVNF